MNEEIKEILNYFTKYANIEDSIKIGRLKNYITNLQQENKKNKEYSEFYKDMSDKWKDMSDVFKKSCEDYKSRNEKAIELINNVYNSLENVDKPIKFYEDLLNTLQGSDKV